MWFTVYQILFHILFIFSLPQHEYLYMKVCILSLLDLVCEMGSRLDWGVCVDRSSYGFMHCPTHPLWDLIIPQTQNYSTLAFCTPGSPPTWWEFMAGCVCICVCMGVGGWLCAWVRLSSLLLFDGTHCAFMHYSCHAKGATLGQGFGKSMPEPFINSTA